MGLGAVQVNGLSLLVQVNGLRETFNGLTPTAFTRVTLTVLKLRVARFRLACETVIEGAGTACDEDEGWKIAKKAGFWVS